MSAARVAARCLAGPSVTSDLGALGRHGERVRDAARRQDEVAGAGRDPLVADDDLERAGQDEERLVGVVVDVQRRGGAACVAISSCSKLPAVCSPVVLIV